MPLGGSGGGITREVTDDRPTRDDRTTGQASSIIGAGGSSDLSSIIGFSGGGAGGVSILNTICIRNTANISLTSGSETDVTFNTLDFKGQSYNWQSAASKKLIFAYGNNGIEIGGKAHFAANSTGRRTMSVYFYNAAGSSLGSEVLFNCAATSAGEGVYPINLPIYLPALYPNTAYIQFTATQDSGSPINLTKLFVSVYVII